MAASAGYGHGTRRWTVLAAFGCLALLAAAPNRPQPPSADAARLAREGATALEERRYADAEAAWRAVLAIVERDHGGESLEAAAAMSNLAYALEKQRRFTEAELLHRRAQAIVLAYYAPWRTAGRHRDVAEDSERREVDSYGVALGYNLLQQGRQAEAQVIFARVKALHASAGDPSWEPMVFAVTGDLPGVVSYHATGVSARTREPTPDELRQIHRLSVEMQTASGADRFEVLYRKLLALQESTLGPTHPETIETRQARVGALLRLERYAEAEAAGRETLALQGTQAAVSATIWSTYLIAAALRGQNRPDEAEPLLRTALAGFEADDPRGSLARQAALDLGALHLDRGDPAGAELYYRRAGDAYAAVYGPYFPDTLSVRTMIGSLLMEQGRYAEAAAAYRATCRGRTERARSFDRGEHAAGSSSAMRAGDASDCARRLANALRRVKLSGSGAEPEERLRAEAFAAAQTFQQSAAGDSLARAGARVAAAAAGAGKLAAAYEARLAERSALDETIGKLATDLPATSATRAELAATRQRLDSAIAALAVDVAQGHPLYWDLRSPQPLDLAALQARTGPDAALLRDDEALILFMVPRGELTGLVFAVSRKGAAWADIPMTGDEMEARIHRLRTQIDPRAYGLEAPAPAREELPPGRGKFDRQAAFELYQALLGDPAIQSVIVATPTLLIVPSGPLTSLPPGLLVTAPPEGGAEADADQAALRRTPWLLRSKAIALLPSVSSLRILRQLLPAGRAAAPDPLLAFTNPDFSGGSEGVLGVADRGIPRSLQAYYREGRPLADALRSLPPLGGTIAEGEDLARALGAPPSAILTGRDASKAQLFARNRDGRLAKVRVIDFATHGLVAGDALGLVEPALALARGASPEEGLLTASDAATLILNADWVLLSACNTASPDATEAQGLSGLSRAFFHAGARSLLVSHWRVNDGIAAFLVPEILAAQRRNPGLSRAAAVQQASLAVLDDTRIPGAHPAMWAPFTLIGEAGR